MEHQRHAQSADLATWRQQVKTRPVVQVGAFVWAAVGATVALGSLGSVAPDARAVVGMVSVLGPLAALLAASAVAHHHDRLSGLLLLVSSATPTYFAWVLNAPALLLGLALTAAPTAIMGRPRIYQD